jgi:hypothetical protein
MTERNVITIGATGRNKWTICLHSHADQKAEQGLREREMYEYYMP